MTSIQQNKTISLKEWVVPITLAGVMIGTYGTSNFTISAISGVALTVIGLHGVINSLKKIEESGVKAIGAKECLKTTIHLAALISGLVQLNSANSIKSDFSGKFGQFQNEINLLKKKVDLKDHQQLLINHALFLTQEEIHWQKENVWLSQLDLTRLELTTQISNEITRLNNHINNITSNIEKCNHNYYCKSKVFEKINTNDLQKLRAKFCRNNQNYNFNFDYKEYLTDVCNNVFSPLIRKIDRHVYLIKSLN